MGKKSGEGRGLSDVSLKSKGSKKQRQKIPKKEEEDIADQDQPQSNAQIKNGKNSNAEEPSGAWYEHLKSQISKERDSVINLYKSLGALGMSSQVINDIESGRRVRESAQKAAQSLTSKYVIDAQNTIFDAQRALFKKVSDLERAHQKSKSILSANKNLTSKDVDEVLGHVDAKIENLKSTIYTWNKVVEKGDVALGKSKLPQQ